MTPQDDPRQRPVLARVPVGQARHVAQLAPEREIRPHLQSGMVSYICRPSLTRKVELLQHATAVLLPSLVDETSSLVAMEAMACGTPVVAFRRGAIPEVVRDGVTGFVVDTVDEMERAVSRAGDIGPIACRAHVEANFTAARMAGDYEQMYYTVVRAHVRESRRLMAA